MGIFAGYLIRIPKLRAWLEKHNSYSEETAVGFNLRFLLKEHGMYGRLIRSIIPFEHEGEIVYLLARVVQKDDMSPGLMEEEEQDREAKKELLNHGGLEEGDLEWVTCSSGC